MIVTRTPNKRINYMKKRNVKKTVLAALLIVCSVVAINTSTKMAKSVSKSDIEALSYCEVFDPFGTLKYYCKGEDGRCRWVIGGETLICSGMEQIVGGE